VNEHPHARPRRGPWRIPPGGLLVVAAAVLAACEAEVVTPARVVSVEILPAEITLWEGEDRVVTAIAREHQGGELSGYPVVWSVDDPGIATVTPDGVVEARAPGTTRIHATVAGITGTASLTVLAGPDEPDPGACEYSNRTFGRDLKIAEDTHCTLTNVRIRGDLELGRGSTVIAAELRVDGDIEGKSANVLKLTSSRVDGDIQFEDGGSVEVRQTEIDGNLQLESNHGSLHVEGNRVEGNVQVFKNRGGPFTISDNGIGGHLQCKENEPAPIGGGNVVDGEKEDQCRNL
jgi:cytoskeletal protein CcmA (bactofilin family)